MTKNAAKIRAGISALAGRPYEVISGTVVAGTFDTDANTISVLPTDATDDTQAIPNVTLNSVSENSNGLILYPKDDSNVIIGSIDGPGEWTLLKASDIDKLVITIGNVVYEMDSEQVNIQNGNTVLNLSDSLFKMNTSSENLFQLLKDLITYITALTVETPAGTSSVPVNIADFNNLLSRLNNLLTS